MKVTKFGLEVLIGKALSVWLEFIDETGKKVFCLQMEIKGAFLPANSHCDENFIFNQK